jgi:hypothetical protein
MIYPEEHDSLPVMMRLYADTFTLAAQLGFLAAQLRQDKQSRPSEFDQRAEEINNLRQAFSRLWEAPDVSYWSQHRDNLPRRSEEILQQVSQLIWTLRDSMLIFLVVGNSIPFLSVVLIQQYVAWSASRVRIHA